MLLLDVQEFGDWDTEISVFTMLVPDTYTKKSLKGLVARLEDEYKDERRCESIRDELKQLGFTEIKTIPVKSGLNL